MLEASANLSRDCCAVRPAACNNDVRASAGKACCNGASDSGCASGYQYDLVGKFVQ